MCARNYSMRSTVCSQCDDSGRVLSHPEVIQIGTRGSVMISRLMGSDRDCARLTGNSELMAHWSVAKILQESTRDAPGIEGSSGLTRNSLVWRDWYDR
jgi:hypothetical protein